MKMEVGADGVSVADEVVIVVEVAAAVEGAIGVEDEVAIVPLFVQVVAEEWVMPWPLEPSTLEAPPRNRQAKNPRKADRSMRL